MIRLDQPCACVCIVKSSARSEPLHQERIAAMTAIDSA
nr:MAG TPA: hypothetical protein [Caudoviricetes sp.]